MSSLNINGIAASVSGSLTPTRGTDNSKLNSIMTIRQQKSEYGNYNAFQNAVSESKLGANVMNENDLAKKGFERSDYIDMNGGRYYENKKTGESIRKSHDFLTGGTSLNYRNDNMAHYAAYDENGKETNGVIQIKQPDGTIKVYDYEVDINGNKFIKSIQISELDYFATYE